MARSLSTDVSFAGWLRPAVACVLTLQMLAPAGLVAQMAEQPQMAPAQTGGAQKALARAANPGANAGVRLTDDERLLHVLDRFTYGPRPGDLERVKAIGLQAWLSEQMNPQRIDDSKLEARLAEYPALQMPLGQMMAAYPTRGMVRQEAQGKVNPMVPGGEAERAIYNDQMARERAKKQGKNDDAMSDVAPMDPAQAQALLALPPDKRFSALCKMSLDQIRSLRQALKGPDRERLTEGFTPQQFEAFAAFQNPQQVIAAEATDAKLLRDIYTERQLQEVMVDFWLNHFNVYIKKSQQAPYYIASYERSAIRPRALGKFEDLLTATAMSPAMLNYLDNSESVGPHSAFANRPQQGGKGKRPSGLNENYARELMELHTLGVNGGYTQHDVTEVAKVFTGWTVGSKKDMYAQFRTRVGSLQNRDVDEPIQPEFDAAKHEPGPKTVLGVTIKESGEKEGLEVLHMLATSPATAKFISTKLAVRFVSDDPPPALVDRMARKFVETQGVIRLVLLTMINSPEFWTRDAYRAKVKTPQEFVVSAVRASGAEVTTPAALVAQIADLGMPLFGMQTPNGYSMKADPWNNTGALVSRMNFALALASNKVPGVVVNWPGLLGPEGDAMTPEAKDAALEAKLLHEPVSDRTRQTILAQISADRDQQEASLRQIAVKNAKRDPLTVRGLVRPPDASNAPMDTEAALAAGLLFGSPEFQRR
jgi:uncharacterized protein (DUF1800 family)